MNTKMLTRTVVVLSALVLTVGGLSATHSPAVVASASKDSVSTTADTTSTQTSENVAPVVAPNSDMTPLSTPVDSSAISSTTVFTKVESKTVEPTATPKPIKVVVSPGTTVATHTTSGVQTITVKTKRVTVSVTPKPVASPTASVTPSASPSPATAPWVAPVLPPSDWNGFIAPKVAFDKLTYCKQSPTAIPNPVFGGSGKPYFLNWRIRLYDGYFNYNGVIYAQSDVLYLNASDSTVERWIGNMDLANNTWTPLSLDFMPFNWKNGGSGNTADSTPKTVNYTYKFYSSQAECDSLANLPYIPFQ